MLARQYLSYIVKANTFLKEFCAKGFHLGFGGTRSVIGPQEWDGIGGDAICHVRDNEMWGVEGLVEG